MKEKGDSKIYTNCNIITLNIHQEKKEEGSHRNFFLRRLVGGLFIFFIELMFSSWFGGTVYPHIVNSLIGLCPIKYLAILSYLLAW